MQIVNFGPTEFQVHHLLSGLNFPIECVGKAGVCLVLFVKYFRYFIGWGGLPVEHRSNGGIKCVYFN